MAHRRYLRSGPCFTPSCMLFTQPISPIVRIFSDFLDPLVTVTITQPISIDLATSYIGQQGPDLRYLRWAIWRGGHFLAWTHFAKNSLKSLQPLSLNYHLSGGIMDTNTLQDVDVDFHSWSHLVTAGHTC